MQTRAFEARYPFWSGFKRTTKRKTKAILRLQILKISNNETHTHEEWLPISPSRSEVPWSGQMHRGKSGPQMSHSQNSGISSSTQSHVNQKGGTHLWLGFSQKSSFWPPFSGTVTCSKWLGFGCQPPNLQSKWDRVSVIMLNVSRSNAMVGLLQIRCPHGNLAGIPPVEISFKSIRPQAKGHIYIHVYIYIHIGENQQAVENEQPSRGVGSSNIACKH